MDEYSEIGGKFAHCLVNVFEKMRAGLIDSMVGSHIEEMSRVVEEDLDDTIYSLDITAEDVLVPLLEQNLPRLGGAVVIAEGVEEIVVNSDKGEKPRHRILIDPIDGTRCLMYGKRSAWALAAVAPDKGSETRMSDAFASVMVELPTPRAALADSLWAVKSDGIRAETVDLREGIRKQFTPRPSGADGLRDGFAMISRFFPGGKDIIAAVEEDFMMEAVGPPVKGRATVFEDQYIATGGQWSELIMGRDRFCADIRKAVYELTSKTRGYEPGHCCRPHDAAGLLAATEAGVIITDLEGKQLDAPFDTRTDLDWVGYANPQLKRKLEGPFRAALQKHGLLKEP